MLRAAFALAAFCLLAFAAVPTASAADCLVTVRGLCVRDPGTNPCDSILACEFACGGALSACIHVDRCLAGDVSHCVELEKYCLHADCPPRDV